MTLGIIVAAAARSAAACMMFAALVSGRGFDVPSSAEPLTRDIGREMRVRGDLVAVYRVARVGDIPEKDTLNLLDGVRKAASEDGTIVVTVLDGGMLDMGVNMIRSLDAVPCRSQKLIIGLGSSVCSAFREFNKITCVETFQDSASSEDEVAWGSHEYWQVVFRKHVVLTLVAVSSIARHVIYTDPDIVFLDSPVSYLVHGFKDDYDIVFSPNNMLEPEARAVDEVAATYATRGMKQLLVGPEQRRADINTGLFILHSSATSANLMLKTMEIFKAQELAHGHYQQYSLAQALDQLPEVRIGVAGGDRLVNGNVFWGHRKLLEPSEVISIHANWMGPTMKVPCLKEAGLWVDSEAPRRLSFRRPRDGERVAKLDSRGAIVETCGAAAIAATAQPQPAGMPQRSEAPTLATAQPQPAGMPPKPTEPGCYVWMPSGCPNHKFHAQDTWRRREDARDDSHRCLVTAKAVFDKWCGTSETQMLFVPPPMQDPPAPEVAGPTASKHFPGSVAPSEPKEPGCYVWLPTGCKDHPLATADAWVRDIWGDQNMGRRASRTTCEDRKAQIDSWCGVVNAKMLLAEGS